MPWMKTNTGKYRIKYGVNSNDPTYKTYYNVFWFFYVKLYKGNSLIQAYKAIEAHQNELRRIGKHVDKVSAVIDRKDHSASKRSRR